MSSNRKTTECNQLQTFSALHSPLSTLCCFSLTRAILVSVLHLSLVLVLVPVLDLLGVFMATHWHFGASLPQISTTYTARESWSRSWWGTGRGRGRGGLRWNLCALSSALCLCRCWMTFLCWTLYASLLALNAELSGRAQHPNWLSSLVRCHLALSFGSVYGLLTPSFVYALSLSLSHSHSQRDNIN